MRRELSVLLGLLLVACGSSSGGPGLVTTQIYPNLPSEDVSPLPVPEVPPQPVLPPLDAGTASDAARE
jgi:hypothetical protein